MWGQRLRGRVLSSCSIKVGKKSVRGTVKAGKALCSEQASLRAAQRYRSLEEGPLLREGINAGLVKAGYSGSKKERR